MDSSSVPTEHLRSSDAVFLIERYTSIQPYNSGLRETVKKALSIPVSLIKRQAAVAPGPFIRTAM